MSCLSMIIVEVYTENDLIANEQSALAIEHPV